MSFIVFMFIKIYSTHNLQRASLAQPQLCTEAVPGRQGASTAPKAGPGHSRHLMLIWRTDQFNLRREKRRTCRSFTRGMRILLWSSFPLSGLAFLWMKQFLMQENVLGVRAKAGEGGWEIGGQERGFFMCSTGISCLSGREGTGAHELVPWGGTDNRPWQRSTVPPAGLKTAAF